MLAIVVSLIIGFLAGFALHLSNSWISINWCVTLGVIVFIALQVLLGFYVRKLVKKRTESIQGIMEEGQKKINRRVQHFQMKQQGDMKMIQRVLENEQNVFIREALSKVDTLYSLCRWNIMLKKQIHTMKFQFHYQLKEFKDADMHMAKAMFVEPISAAMKIARLYKNNDSSYINFFKKKIKKFKKNEFAPILYGVYSWILVKNKKITEAIEVLEEGKKATSNETIAKNWELLVNGKIEKFSNAGLGDHWYALYLEEPKAQKAKQQMIRQRR